MRIKFKSSPLSSQPDLSGLLEKQYRRLVAQHHIHFDNAQLSALQHLQVLLEKLPDLATPPLSRFLLRAKLRQHACQSLYIFGDVGRGKSMLMSLFFEACPIQQKRRVHFSAFMQEVHRFIHEYPHQQQTDAISALAKSIRETTLLLCFDEFHITDIADAMILGRLFTKLFDLGLVMVITSNRHPSDLYQGGLLREQFLFFIQILQASAHIVELVAQQDYRRSGQTALHQHYYFPLDEQAKQFAQRHFDELSHFAKIRPVSLTILGHPLLLTAVHQTVVLAKFNELCAVALGPADYLYLAQKFSHLILMGIPKLRAEQRNEAKRLVTLIDVLYEHKVKLICTAEVPAEQIYTEGDGAFEFKRTVSRLIEMQSDAYYQSASPTRMGIALQH